LIKVKYCQELAGLKFARKSAAMKRNVLLVCFSQDLIPRHQAMLGTMVSAGYCVTVVTWNRAKKTQNEISGVRYISTDISAPHSSLSIIFYIRKYLRAVVSLLKNDQNFDICILTHLMMLPLSNRIEAQNYVYDIAEYLNYDLSDYFSILRSLIRPIIEAYEKRYIRKLDGVTYVGSRDGWLADYVSEAKLSLEINNFPDLSREPSVEDVSKLKDRYHGKKIVIYIGGLSLERGTLDLVRAVPSVLSSVPEAHFLLMGRLREDTHQTLQEIEKLGVQDSVEVIPHLDFEKMLAYLSIATLGVALYDVYRGRSASSKFGKYNSRKILTYMQMGLPVLVSRGNPFSEFVIDSNCGSVVDPKDMTDLTKQIVNGLEPRFDLFGKAGLSEIRRKYNWQNEERKLLRFLDKVQIENQTTKN